jgi:IS1 family transposase
MSKLSLAQRAEIIEHLMEGSGVRPTARLCGVDHKTVLSLHGAVGRGAIMLHNEYVRGVDATHIDIDELHSFVKKRQQHVVKGDSPDVGEQWVWLALTRASKLILSYHVSKRTQENGDAFLLDVRSRLTTLPVISSDAWPGYPRAVGQAFCGPDLPPGGVDYGQIVKSFSGRRRDYDKVAPADGPVRVAKRVIWGAPDLSEIHTSLSERENLNYRTHLRRLVRRGTGHSKKYESHLYTIAGFSFWRNFCLPHGALNGRTPAQAASLADHRWSTAEFVEAALEADECAPPEPVVLRAREGAPGATRRTSTGALLRAVPKAGRSPTATPTIVKPGVAKVGGPGAAPAHVEPAGDLALVYPPAQGDLWTWAATHATARQLDPWEALEAELPAALEKPLPPMVQLALFGETEGEK